MSKITYIGGDYIEWTGGTNKLFSKEGIEITSNESNIFNAGEGQTYGEPEKPPVIKHTDLRIIKLEGPFDKEGKLVETVKKGTFYTYKATPNRKPNEIEIKMLKWATQSDKGKKKELKKVFSYNQLDKEGKIVINIAINEDCEKAKVYACFIKAREKVSVEVNNSVFRPYIIAKSRHRKGMDEKGEKPHHDMMSGDMTDAEIIALNPDTKKWIDIVNKEGFKGIQKLSNEMADLLTDFSMGELEEVNLKMHRKFIKNEPGEFTDSILTQVAIDHEHSKKFFERIKTNMGKQLNLNPNFVFEKKLLTNHEIIDKGKTKEKQRKDIPSPSYPDKYGGLGISINDTWGYDIKITKFMQDDQKRTYSAEFGIEIFDHYGLNSEDIDPKVKGGFFGSASFEGFLCWFILQHKCGYKPFYTILKMKHKITNATY
jgi:hypothetical protein